MRSDSVELAWGLCGPPDNGAFCYRIGDVLRWRSDLGAAPAAFTVFEGPEAMINHGDPDIVDTWVLDGGVWYDGPFDRCESCGTEMAAVIHIVHGVVRAVLALPVDDGRVVQAIEEERRLDSAVYRKVRWDHGVSDADLEEINEWLRSYAGLVPIGTLRDSFDDETEDKYRLRQAHMKSALIEGNRLFSRRLVCHAIARLIESDPDILDWQLERAIGGFEL